MHSKPTKTGNRHSRRGRSFLFLSLRHFVILAVFGLLVWRINTAPSVFDSATPTSDNRRHPLDKPGVFGNVVEPRDWRSWLASHKNMNTTDLSIQKEEATSQHTDWGCGVSIRLLFEPKPTRSLPIPSFTKAFFKASHADMSHYDAESHLREIKAYYLDRILETNVVLPCIGYHLDRVQITDKNEWAVIEKNTECVRSNNNNKANSNGEAKNKTKSTVEGSMMLWMNDLESIARENIVKSSKVSNSSEYHPEQESAMNYAIFHYLGACMKSEHNHFHHTKKRTYVAIDNDRCLTPKVIFSNRDVVPDLHFNRIQLWKDLVYE